MEVREKDMEVQEEIVVDRIYEGYWPTQALFITKQDNCFLHFYNFFLHPHINGKNNLLKLFRFPMS